GGGAGVGAVAMACKIVRILMSSSKLLNCASCETNSVPSLGSSGFCPCSCATSSCRNCVCCSCAVRLDEYVYGVGTVPPAGCVVVRLSIMGPPSFGAPSRWVTSKSLLRCFLQYSLA